MANAIVEVFLAVFPPVGWREDVNFSSATVGVQGVGIGGDHKRGEWGRGRNL